MFVQIPQVLTSDQLIAIRAALDRDTAPWVDGRVTAGHQGALVKSNQQLEEGSPLASELRAVIIAQLERHAPFISATLPHRLYPPMFNRYDTGMQFGTHVDGAIRQIPGSGQKIRTNLSATLFLTSPESYDGGELVIHSDLVKGTVWRYRRSGHRRRVWLAGHRNSAMHRSATQKKGRAKPGPESESMMLQGRSRSSVLT